MTTSTLSILNPSVGIALTRSTAFITSFSVLITNEYISKLKKKLYQNERLDKCNYSCI